METNEKLVASLSQDLRTEYGLALRYLHIINNLRAQKDVDSANMLTALATDSISHSHVVRNLLNKQGVEPSNQFTLFHPEFHNIDRALTSSYLVERHMAKYYQDLANELGESHEAFRPLNTLAQWEREHMKNVMWVIKRRKEGSMKPEKIDRSAELEKKAEELAEKELDLEEKEKFVLGREQKVDEELIRTEKILADALEADKGIREVLDRLVAEEKGKEIIENMGVSAEETVEPSDMKLLWGEDTKYTAYCLKCRDKRNVEDPQKIVLASTRPAIKGKCDTCGTTVYSTVKWLPIPSP